MSAWAGTLGLREVNGCRVVWKGHRESGRDIVSSSRSGGVSGGDGMESPVWRQTPGAEHGVKFLYRARQGVAGLEVQPLSGARSQGFAEGRGSEGT